MAGRRKDPPLQPFVCEGVGLFFKPQTFEREVFTCCWQLGCSPALAHNWDPFSLSRAAVFPVLTIGPKPSSPCVLPDQGLPVEVRVGG